MVSWFYLIVFIMALTMTVFFMTRNKRVDSLCMLFCILVTINCLGRYLLAKATGVDMAILANKLLYVGGCYAPFLTVILLTELSNIKMSKWFRAGLLAISTFLLILVFSIGYSDIYYRHVELVQADGYSYLVKTYGPLHICYPIMMIVYIIVVLWYLYKIIQKRKQVSFRLVLTICITAVSIILLYLIELVIHCEFSLLSVGYLVGIMFMTEYYERVTIYDMTSNISSSIERMQDYGYIAFDRKLRFANANDYARKLFPEIENWTIDKQVPASNSYLYKEVIQYLWDWDGEEPENKYVCVDDKYYQLDVRALTYGRKKDVGYLLEFSDRTLEKQYYNTIEEYNDLMEEEVAVKTEELRIQQAKMKKLYMQTIAALTEAVDAKDRYTSGHSKRVAKYARMIAERMGKSKEEQDDIFRAGLLHDVGKIRIPAEIINKPGKLTDEEYNTIKLHPVAGYHILRGISDNDFIAVAAKYHHERYDGTGYPNGLFGSNIPEVARILGVADSYDAMTSNRSYRKVLPQDVVRSEIQNGIGSQFDPEVARIMLNMIDEDKDYTLKQYDVMKRYILSVDDEPMNSKIIGHIMKDEPLYEVVTATSGMEALKMLEKKEYDLILLDVRMPGMDGLETLKRIREKYQTPVVLMTGDKTLDISAEFAEYGCDDYITKPFLPIVVKEIVHNMTECTNLENYQ
ncbi:MAG: response regulator [Lachnospiraceae bacterium]|nr:response regulator [Lachnospiraceae bacterium]